MKEYWQKAINFEKYLEIAEERWSNNPNKEDHFQEYYELGLQRMHRILKVFEIDEVQLEKFKTQRFKGKILMISEPWCGDASSTVPAITKFFEAAEIEVKIFLRDSDSSFINQFLTNGTQSIPKIIILNEDFSVKNVWGPRPKHGTELLNKYKENPEAYPKEQFYHDLQIYYSRNRGKDVLGEVLELI